MNRTLVAAAIAACLLLLLALAGPSACSHLFTAKKEARVAKGFGHDLPSPFYRMLHKRFVRAEL